MFCGVNERLGVSEPACLHTEDEALAAVVRHADGKAWLEFTRDGQYIADQIVSINDDC